MTKSTNSEANIAKGSCLCGQIELTIKGELRDIIYCHCKQCRKQSGHYFAATACDKPNLHIDGEEHLTWYQSSQFARRGFCKHCGSALLWEHFGAEHISILAGAIDEKNILKEDCHIYCDSKGDYFELTDDLPKYAQLVE